MIASWIENVSCKAQLALLSSLWYQYLDFLALKATGLDLYLSNVHGFSHVLWQKVLEQIMIIKGCLGWEKPLTQTWHDVKGSLLLYFPLNASVLELIALEVIAKIIYCHQWWIMVHECLCLLVSVMKSKGLVDDVLWVWQSKGSSWVIRTCLWARCFLISCLSSNQRNKYSSKVLPVLWNTLSVVNWTSGCQSLDWSTKTETLFGDNFMNPCLKYETHIWRWNLLNFFCYNRTVLEVCLETGWGTCQLLLQIQPKEMSKLSLTWVILYGRT